MFERLVAYLQREEHTLRALRAPNLQACLRTGAGSKGREANPERLYQYRNLGRLQRSAYGTLTTEQRHALDQWEHKLCSESDNATEFARVVTILERREAELTAMRKSSLAACFSTSLSNTDQEWKFCRNFFERQKSILTQEQEKVLDAWTEKICGAGAEARPASDAAFLRLIGILERREDDLKARGAHVGFRLESGIRLPAGSSLIDQ